MSYSGISGIGYNPNFNSLGMFGFPSGSEYGSYGDPMLGLSGGMGMMGMGYPGSLGLSNGMGMGMGYGMYNPNFMAQMNDMYHNIEKSNLAHQSAVNNIKNENAVNDYRSENSALFQKAISDNGVQTAILNIAEKIRKPDGDGLVEEYNKLASDLITRYSKELGADGGVSDVSNVVRNYIERLYVAIAKEHYPDTVSLRADILSHGESAFDRGFNTEFFGSEDHSKKYADTALSYIYGTTVEDKKMKDKAERNGKKLGFVAEHAAFIGSGAAAGTTIAAGRALCNKTAHTGKLAFFGAILGLATDLLWQCS